MKQIFAFASVLICATSVQASVLPPPSANPLTKLIGVWVGDKGTDVAPAQEGSGSPAGSPVSSPYFERIEFTEGAGATNASRQDLVTVRYHQAVFRKSDGQQFHDQIGYWIWDRKNNKVLHSFCIPRAVCTTAEGELKSDSEIAVSTDGPFAESEFMKKEGKTNNFSIRMIFNADGTMTYVQTTGLTIYGKSFTHVDSSTLSKSAASLSSSPQAMQR